MSHYPVAIVTGSSSGFGLLSAVELADAGFFVVATMRDLKKRDSLLDIAKSRGVTENIHINQLDVTDFASIKDKVKEWHQKYGRIDVLLNNAGFAMGGFIEEVSLEEWKEQFDTNVFGLIAMTQAVLPYMRKAGKGRIINMSSISGMMGFPGLGPYVSSKFAVEGFSESLRLEVKSFGIDVILIQPGSFQTNIWSTGKKVAKASLFPSSPYHNVMKKIENRLECSKKHFGNPEEVVKLVIHTATANHPRFRYRVGRGVEQQRFLRRILPWKIWEGLLLKIVNK